jgi:Nif-specific regulatory protein
MNAHARLAACDTFDPALAVIEKIAATLAGSGGALESLRRVMALLAEIGLTDAGVAWIGGACLHGVAGRAADAPPQAMTSRLKTFLAKGEAGVLRKEKSPTLGAPVRMGDATVGLLVARVAGRAAGEADLRRLALVANLLGPTLAVAREGDGVVTAPDAKTIIGESPALRAALDEARRVAPTDLPVLLRGESGVGKEVFAQFIHDHSPRVQNPFVKVNCAALPEPLLESELFGHERGAFTGADSRREGRFALADGGTILLDEIGDISPAFQGKLLRVIQEGEFERVGGARTLRVNVRVITATHRDLEFLVRAKKFRADLYYRLCAAPVRLPALRERREDIPALARHILARFNAENGRALALNPRAQAMIGTCPYPGNIRELDNCLRGAAALTIGAEICESDFACRQGRCFSARLRRARIAQGQPIAS